MKFSKNQITVWRYKNPESDSVYHIVFYTGQHALRNWAEKNHTLLNGVIVLDNMYCPNYRSGIDQEYWMKYLVKTNKILQL